MDDKKIRKKKLVIGCGYLGERVARLWQADGNEVFVVTRSVKRAETLASDGYIPIVADVTNPESLGMLPIVDTLLYAVGFDRTSGKSIGEVYAAGLQNVLNSLSDDTGRIIYISSTGVCAQDDGEWIDEDSPCEPTREGGRACLAAEQVLQSHPLGRRGIILRLAGIYGPGRMPQAKLLEAGEPIPSPPDSFLNLIHVDDAAKIVLASEEKANPPRTYCISDGQPAPRRDYYEYLATQLGTPPPRFEPRDDSPPRRGSNKRISNRRMMEELAPTFTYPTYREGLDAITAFGVPESLRDSDSSL